MRLNLITLAVIVVMLVALGVYATHMEWTPVRAVGAVLVFVSGALLITARLQLGASFSVQARAKKLVTTGLYSKIRNPIYVFAEFFLIGLGLMLGLWPLLVIPVALIPVQVARARKEEQVLAAAFGEEYERYKANTWF